MLSSLPDPGILNQTTISFLLFQGNILTLWWVEFQEGYQQIVTTKVSNLVKKNNFVRSVIVKIMKIFFKIQNNATITYAKKVIVGLFPS